MKMTTRMDYSTPHFWLILSQHFVSSNIFGTESPELKVPAIKFVTQTNIQGHL